MDILTKKKRLRAMKIPSKVYPYRLPYMGSKQNIAYSLMMFMAQKKPKAKYFFDIFGGGTIHGKDLSKADCSVNLYCFIKAQETGKPQKAICSIGDKEVNINGELIPFAEIVEKAKEYINKLGGFKKLAEWGLR